MNQIRTNTLQKKHHYHVIVTFDIRKI
jgi:hypothetical protein